MSAEDHKLFLSFMDFLKVQRSLESETGLETPTRKRKGEPTKDEPAKRVKESQESEVDLSAAIIPVKEQRKRLMGKLVGKGLQKYSGRVVIQSASTKYPVAQIAAKFGYYGLDDGRNIAPNIFVCLSCNDLIECKEGCGTNPFNRHAKNCTETFVNMSADSFSEMLTNCLHLAGVLITKDVLKLKLMTIGQINNENIGEVHECLKCLLAPRKSSMFDYKSDEEYEYDTTQYAPMLKPKKLKPNATVISSATIMHSPGRNQFGEAIENDPQYSLNKRPPNILSPSVKIENLTETMITQATLKQSPRDVMRSPSYSPAPNQRINPYAVSQDMITPSHENIHETMREYLKKFTAEEIKAVIMANDPEMETEV